MKKSVEVLDQKLSYVSGSVNSLFKIQREIRTNEHRNLSTVKSTESRIFWFAFLEALVVVGMAVGQVYLIQTFFAKSSRLRV